jgi:two-component system cell cycle response regulator DivK
MDLSPGTRSGSAISREDSGGHYFRGVAAIPVVGDSPDNRFLLRTVLGLAGQQIRELSSGEGLPNALAEARPDLVLLDIQLPGKDGFTLLREIRELAAGNLLVVALTAHAMAGDRGRAPSAGLDGCITRPIDVRQFPAQVALALAGEQVTD